MTNKIEERMTWLVLALTALVFLACGSARVEQYARPVPADLATLPADRYCLALVDRLQPGETVLLVNDRTGRVSVVHRACETWNNVPQCRYLVWPIGTSQDPTLARGYAQPGDFLTDGDVLYGLR